MLRNGPLKIASGTEDASGASVDLAQGPQIVMLFRLPCQVLKPGLCLFQLALVGTSDCDV